MPVRISGKPSSPIYPETCSNVEQLSAILKKAAESGSERISVQLERPELLHDALGVASVQDMNVELIVPRRAGMLAETEFTVLYDIVRERFEPPEILAELYEVPEFRPEPPAQMAGAGAAKTGSFFGRDKRAKADMPAAADAASEQ